MIDYSLIHQNIMTPLFKCECPNIIISLDEYLDIEEKFMQQLDVLGEEYPPKYKTIHIVKLITPFV